MDETSDDEVTHSPDEGVVEGESSPGEHGDWTDEIDALATAICEAERVVALTGAGISAPSGVPTFRGDDGVWERFEEGQFTFGRFQRDPSGFWRDRLALRREMYGDDGFETNEGHRALAELEGDGHLDAIVTQNTDGLHARAAAGVGDDDSDAELIELHGNARRVRCPDCGRRESAEEVASRVENGDVPPQCSCGTVLKPDVVLFGERLPGAALQRARSLASESDVFLAIGSSLVVEPAASLPRLAAGTGATVGIVNLAETPVDEMAHHVVRADVTAALPRLRESVANQSTS